MKKDDIADIKLYIDKKFDKLCERIDDRAKYTIDSFHRQSETSKMVCDRDYQRDTYQLVKELKFNLEQDKIDKQLEKMREEHKYLGSRIQDLEMTKSYREAEYFRSN
ncbi:MAG: hypothetical protein V8Q75_03310 [Bacilli bacterium]